MKSRVQSAKPESVYNRERPASAYQARRKRDTEAGAAQPRQNSSKPTKIKQLPLGKDQQGIPAKTNEFETPWVKDAIQMVKKGHSNRVKIG
jgi:hypothetical protein